MVNLFKEIDLKTNESFIKSVRQVITKWANNIPGHGLSDLGNNVTFTSFHLKPTHRLECWTQYEDRILVKTEEPYTNQKISELKFTSADQVDPWKHNLNKISAYQDKLFKYNVTGSHQIHTCSKCSGRGHNTCLRCTGKGKITCPSCNATGITSCGGCGGRGTTNCGTCSGSGSSNRKRNCSACGGTGKIRGQYNKLTNCNACLGVGTLDDYSCEVCNGSGQQTCKACNGTKRVKCLRCDKNGQITCLTCEGRTIVTCKQCEGHKKMLSFFILNQQFSKRKVLNYQNNEDVRKKFGGFKMESNDYMDNEVFSKETEGALLQDLLTQYDYIKPIYKGTLSDASSRKGRNAKIIQQAIRVLSTDVVDLEYEYGGNKFNMLIYGQHGKVYAPRNPISDIRDDLWIKADVLYKKGKFAESYENLQTTIGMGQNMLESINSLKDKVVEKINSAYKLGALYGTILSTYVFFMATLFFLKKPRFIIPKINRIYLDTDWIPSILPITVYVIFLLLLRNVYKASNRFCANYCLAKIKGNNSRILAGALVSSFFVFLLWLTVMLGNATGITVIFSYLGYYTVQIYQYAISFL